MGRSWIYIAFTTVIITIMISLVVFVIEISTIITLSNRVENSLIAAGWAGFSEIDLNIIGGRISDINDIESRNISLDKLRAENVVRQYIRENFKLDLNYRPTDLSYIPYKDEPVLVDEIKIYNQDELPIVDNGTNITKTTIKITVQIPIDIKLVGLKYAKKTVYVDIDTFQ